MKKLRIYLDTSVFGGCFDDEFSVESNKLIDEIKEGKFILVVSELVFFELRGAPEKVRDLFDSIDNGCWELFDRNDEVEELRDLYVSSGVLGNGSLQDAEHVALATVANTDMIVSWNFRHIVHYDKIRGFHSVNLLKGYRAISIYSPKEVVTP
ncbi:MAG: hypothetical protein NUW37_02890 [Planctomycetes bacterium]|nr:hypothetical protein [Planctomycetota bacterium]